MRRHEWLIEKVLFISAAMAILVIALITVFVVAEGMPLFQNYSLWKFLSGLEWDPNGYVFGIFPMIIGSFYVTLGALILGVPVAVACAVFLAEYAPAWMTRILRPAIELLAGIPSVIFGFWGLVVVVDLIRDHAPGRGLSIVAASIVLAVMILPTVINISEDAIRAVPRSFKEGSLALGATHWQTIRSVILPAARSGILAAIVLGMGRAIGETMAVIMVAGNSPKLALSIWEPVRTLTANVALEMGYAAGDHYRALFATGIVLFIIIMLLNSLIGILPKKAGDER